MHTYEIPKHKSFVNIDIGGLNIFVRQQGIDIKEWFLTCMTWYTKKHISLETLHRIHNCMISHVTQEGKNFTFARVDKT